MLPIRIYPSLLACDFSRLGEETERSERGGCDGLHLDVMDGHFVPNLTVGPDVARAVRRHAKTVIDCHIMVTDPLAVSRWFAEAGVDAITFHAEVATDGALTADAIRGLGESESVKRPIRVGVSVNPDTPIDLIRPYLARVDQVLVMSVFPGFGGQHFLPSVLPKLRALREWGFEGDVQVDGGINDESAALCAEAGANVFIAGSHLFKAPDMAAAICKLRAMAEKASLPKSAARR